LPLSTNKTNQCEDKIYWHDILLPKVKLYMAKSSKQKKSSAGNGKASNDSMLLEFFSDEIKDIYWAEKHIVKTLPKMQKAATSAELKQAFADHLEASKNHAVRLEKVFELLGKKPQAKKCDAMEGITKEGEGIIEETEKGTATRDVGLILAAQKVEHYEISTYGGLCQLAKTLGKQDVADLLYETLGEEKETDELLTQIAENNINYEASAEKN
jgi:ferritin-like metal-binding protein YciE